MDEMTPDELKTERMRRAVIRFAFWAMIVVSVLLVGKYILPVLMPFVLAYLLAWALNRPVSWLKRRCRIPRAVGATLLILVIIFSLSGILMLAGSGIFNWIRDAFSILPQVFNEGIFPAVEHMFDDMENWVAGFDPNVAQTFDTTVNNVLSILSEGISKFSGVVLQGVAGVVTGVPQFLMKTLIMFIATVFISTDFRTVKRFLVRLLPESSERVLKVAGTYFGKTVPRYLLTYLMILCLTFTELLIGLSMLGVTSAPMIAFFIAVLDILPVLGTGTIVIPWAIIAFIQGRFGFATGMAVLYVVITVIRQIIEPRLVGAQIKLHPVLTFAAMLTGISLFGFWGLFGLPFGLAFLRELNDVGIIHIRALEKGPDPEEEDRLEAEEADRRKERRRAKRAVSRKKRTEN